MQNYTKIIIFTNIYSFFRRNGEKISKFVGPVTSLSCKDIVATIGILNNLNNIKGKGGHGISHRSLNNFVETMKEYVDQEWMENIPLYAIQRYLNIG